MPVGPTGGSLQPPRRGLVAPALIALAGDGAAAPRPPSGRSGHVKGRSARTSRNPSWFDREVRGAGGARDTRSPPD
jgi:hypothetical protein